MFSPEKSEKYREEVPGKKQVSRPRVDHAAAADLLPDFDGTRQQMAHPVSESTDRCRFKWVEKNSFVRFVERGQGSLPFFVPVLVHKGRSDRDTRNFLGERPQEQSQMLVERTLGGRLVI